MSRPPGRRQGTSAPSQRAASSAGKPRDVLDHERRERAAAKRQLAGGERDVERHGAPCGRAAASRSASGRLAASTSTSARPPRATASPSQGGPSTTTGAEPGGPARERRQRRRAAERTGEQWTAHEGRDGSMTARARQADEPRHELLRAARARTRRRTESAARRARCSASRRSGSPVPPAIVVTTDLFAALRADGPPLPATLTEPDALATHRARRPRARRRRPGPRRSPQTLAREVDTLVPEPGARFSVRSSASIEDEAGAAGGRSVPVARRRRARRGARGGARRARLRAVAGRRRLPRPARPARGRPGLRGAHPPVRRRRRGRRRRLRPRRPRSRRPSRSTPATRTALKSGAAQAPRRTPLRTLGAALRRHRGRVGRGRRRAHLPPAPPLPPPTGKPLASATVPIARGRASSARAPSRRRGTLRGSELADWHWDAAHNPLPLSPAQAGLVALVDERCKTGLRQRVVGGYLFYATDPGSSTTPIEPAEALRALGESAARAARAADADAGAGARDLHRRLPAAVRRRAAERAREARRAGGVPAPPRVRSHAAPAQAAHRRAVRGDRAGAPRARARDARSRARRAGRRSPPTSRSSATRRRAGTSPRRPGARRRRARAAGARRQHRPAGRRPGLARRRRRGQRAAAGRGPRRVGGAALGRARRRRRGRGRRRALRPHPGARARGRCCARGSAWSRAACSTAPTRSSGCRSRPCGARRGARSRSATRTPRPLIAPRSAPTPRRGPIRRRSAPPTAPTSGPASCAGLPGAIGARIGRVRLYGAHHDHDQAADQILVARTLLPTELPLLAPAAIVVETGGRARPRRRAGTRARHPGGRRRGGRLPPAARRRSGPRRRRRRPGRPARLTPTRQRTAQRSSGSASSDRYSRMTSSRLLSLTRSAANASVAPAGAGRIPGHPDLTRAPRRGTSARPCDGAAWRGRGGDVRCGGAAPPTPTACGSPATPRAAAEPTSGTRVAGPPAPYAPSRTTMAAAARGRTGAGSRRARDRLRAVDRGRAGADVDDDVAPDDDAVGRARQHDRRSLEAARLDHHDRLRPRRGARATAGPPRARRERGAAARTARSPSTAARPRTTAAPRPRTTATGGVRAPRRRRLRLRGGDARVDHRRRAPAIEHRRLAPRGEERGDVRVVARRASAP